MPPDPVLYLGVLQCDRRKLVALAGPPFGVVLLDGAERLAVAVRLAERAEDLGPVARHSGLVLERPEDHHLRVLLEQGHDPGGAGATQRGDEDRLELRRSRGQRLRLPFARPMPTFAPFSSTTPTSTSNS